MDYAESYQQNLENFLISAKYGDFFMLNPLSNGSLDWDVKFDEYGTLRDDIKKKRVKNGTLAQKVGRYQNQIPI